METVALNNENIQEAFAVEGFQDVPFQLRYDPDEDMEFIVHTPTGHAVWGGASSSGVELMFFNKMAEFGYDEYELFVESFWEIIEELEESGVATLDDAFATA